MEEHYLDKEIAWFNDHRDEWLAQHRGKWAVIHQQALVGIFDSFPEAYEAGVKQTKSAQILVRQILEKQEPIEVSVNLSLGLFHAPVYS